MKAVIWIWNTIKQNLSFVLRKEGKSEYDRLKVIKEEDLYPLKVLLFIFVVSLEALWEAYDVFLWRWIELEFVPKSFNQYKLIVCLTDYTTFSCWFNLLNFLKLILEKFQYRFSYRFSFVVPFLTPFYSCTIYGLERKV